MDNIEKDVEYLKRVFTDENAADDTHTVGHRERTFKAMENNSNFDFSTLTDVQMLEMYLMTLIPRKDVKPIAYDLLETFGSLGAVSKAELYELMQIDGIGLNTARNLTMSIPFCIRCCESTSQESIVVHKPVDVVNYISPSYLGAINELAYIMFLDNRNKVIQRTLLSKGFVGQVRIDNTKILQIATKISAAKAILIHNHPSGDVIPSDADVIVTSRLLGMLYRINIDLLDHIILGKNGDYFSIMKNRSNDVFEFLKNKSISNMLCAENLKENVSNNNSATYDFSSNDLNIKLKTLTKISNIITNKNQTPAEFNYFSNTKYNEENFLDL